MSPFAQRLVMFRARYRLRQGELAGKQRLNFATLITKEHLNFPAADRYHVDIVTHVNFMTGKLNAD